jgi:uncharacterized membrane protein YdjX (TVP38/TMEM64 family)
LRDYFLASLAVLPGTFLYAYYGRVIGDVVRLAEGAQVERGFEYYALLGLGLVATVAATAMITRIVRQALAEAMATQQPSVDPYDAHTGDVHVG